MLFASDVSNWQRQSHIFYLSPLGGGLAFVKHGNGWDGPRRVLLFRRMSVFVPYTYIDLGVAIEEEEDLDARGVTSKIMSKSRSGCHVAIEQDVQNPRNIYWPFLRVINVFQGCLFHRVSPIIIHPYVLDGVQYCTANLGFHPYSYLCFSNHPLSSSACHQGILVTWYSAKGIFHIHE